MYSLSEFHINAECFSYKKKEEEYSFKEYTMFYTILKKMMNVVWGSMHIPTSMQIYNFKANAYLYPL